MIINRYAKGGGLSPRIVVSVATGTTVTCSKGATTLTATSVDGKCSFNVNDYGVWTVATDFDTQTVNVEYVQLYEVTLKAVSSSLNDNDWAIIRNVADRSEGANYWAVGDTKQITINGKLSDGLTLSNYSTWVYIIGFDHNKDVEGTGIAFQGFKTAQTGGVDVALCDSGYSDSKTSGQWFNMNNAQSNAGGWASCLMRTTTIPVVKTALPSDLISVIKTTSIYSDNTGGGSGSASYVTATHDDIYLLAEFEIFGSRTGANTAEQNYQQQYAYYVAGNSKIKYKHNSTATAANWWERSATAGNATYFCCVNYNSRAEFTFAYYSRGLAPAFKVGGVITKPASSLDVGSSVYAKESGVNTEFIVVHQGNPDTSIYDTSCDGTWLMRKDGINLGVWNNTVKNDYEASDIENSLRTYLLNKIDSATRSIIKQVKIPYHKGTGNSGSTQQGANGLSCKAFLLSCKEINYIHNYSDGGEGYVLDYFSSCATIGADSRRTAGYNGTWWLRSPNIGNSYDAFSVTEDGNCASPNTNNTGPMTRPCFIIPSDTEVDELGNIVV